jgi:hypothetical protein
LLFHIINQVIKFKNFPGYNTERRIKTKRWVMALFSFLLAEGLLLGNGCVTPYVWLQVYLTKDKVFDREAMPGTPEILLWGFTIHKQ